MASFHRVVGIDLGTTYSVIAAYSFDKQDVKVIPNRQGEPTTPSVVYISGQGATSVGRPAKEKLARDPGGVLIEVKRLMGEMRDGRKQMVQAAGKEFDPEFISACILKELKACAEKMIGEPVHDAVITVPAYFKESQKNATREAARIAKLNPRLIMNEPTAAAVAYGLESGEQQTFLVYDLGGGTFDVSIVRVSDEKTVDVLGTGGDARLGGGDIDQKIVDWALERMRQQFKQDFSQDAKLVGRLRLKAEQVKITLCNERTSQEFFLENVSPTISEISYTLEQAQFEQMVRTILEKTLIQVDVALASAGKNHETTLEDIDAIILVGGSSKIPLVAQLLKEKYRRPIKSNLNPDEIVALGAAMMARNYEPSLAAELRDGQAPVVDTAATPPGALTDTHIKDVVSHTLGIGLVDDLYDPLIPKDHVIPHRVVRAGYTTAKDNQTSIFVPVYQGEEKKASLNFKLGEVVIDGLTPEPKGNHLFEITFALDPDGIFEGQIRHLKTGVTKPITLDRGQGAMTEKKRLALSQVLSGGSAFAESGAAESRASEVSDPVGALVAKANEQIPSLPPERQREMVDIVNRINLARAENNVREQGTLVSQLTIAIMRNRK